MKNFYTQNIKTLSLRKHICFAIVFLLLVSNALNAQIAQRGTSTSNAVSGTDLATLTISKPTGVVSGDVLLVSILQNETDNDNGGLSDATASGWTLVDGRTLFSAGTADGDNTWYGTVLYRVADGSEGASFDFTLPNSRADLAVGSIVAFSGVAISGGVNADGSAGGPFDVDPQTLTIANSTSATADPLAISSANSAVLMLSMAADNLNYSAWSATNPASLTELYDNASGAGDFGSVGAAWSIAATGTTGTGTVSLSGSNYNAAIFLVLKPCAVAGVLSGNQTICPAGSTTFTSDGDVGGAWSSSNTAAATVNSLSGAIAGVAPGTSTISYTITGTGGCANSVATRTVTVSPATPAAPVANAGSNAGCTSLTANWTAAANASAYFLDVATDNTFTSLVSGYNNLNVGNVTTFNVTGLTSGITYFYRVRATNSCGTSASSGTITFATLAVPAQPSVIGGTLNPEIGVTQAYSVTNVVGVTYTWSLSPANGWSIASGQGSNAIVANVGTANTTFTVTPSNACGSGSTRTVTTTLPQFRARFISVNFGSSTWCSGTSRSISVVVKNNGTTTWADAAPDVNIGVKWNGWSDYLYRMNAGGLAPGATQTYTFPLMQASNVSGGAAAGLPPPYTTNLPSGSNNLTFDMVQEGVCWFVSCTPGNTAFTSSAITILPGTPSQPGIISGTASFSAPATGQSYSVALVAGVTYNWTVPTGWTITAGAGTNNITVNTGTAGQNGNISVTAQNSCGTSIARTLAVNVCSSAPAQPGAISGTSDLCPGVTGQIFSVTPIADASTYNWTVPTGWTITAGAGTNTITVTTGSTGQNGNISVTAQNVCGTSAAQTLAATVLPGTPAAPVAAAGSNAACTSLSANWAASSNATAYFLDVSTVNTFASFVSGYSNLNVGNVTTFSVTGLSASTTYFYRVRANNSCGTSVSSGTISFATTPPTPAAPVAAAGTVAACTSISANWAASANATAYLLDVATDNTFASLVINNLNVGNVTTYSVTGLTAGTTYFYRVRANNVCGTSGNSATITYATLPATPVAPVAAVGTSAACTSISANWAASANATAYFLDVSTDNAFASFVTNNLNVGNVTTRNITGLTAGTTYFYRVRANNSCGTSANSAVIAYATLPATPDAPVSAAGTNAACTSISANWAASANATAYFLDVSTVNTFATFVTGFSNLNVGNVTTRSITGLTAGTTYFYRVRANNSCGTSANSAVITYATLPATPAAPVASAGTNAACTSISTNWAASANATTYFLDVSTNGSFSPLVSGYSNLDVGNVSTYSVTGLTAGTTYFYRIRANNSCGTSSNSTTISYATLPATPAQPGVITGTAAQCPALSSQTYSIAAVTNASTYNWTVPTGWTITAGAGTTSITVSTGLTGENGNIGVTAQNSCGTSIARTLAVTVNPPVPVQPGSITGTSAQCPGLTGQIYSIAAVPNATTYTWTVPVGWTITAGAGTTSITVTTGATGANGNVGVRAQNSCGISAVQNLAVVVNPGIPAQPSAITGLLSPEIGLTQAYSLTNVAGVSYAWSFSGPNGWSVASGQGTNAIVANVGTNNTTISVVPSNSCGTGVARTIGTTIPQFRSRFISADYGSSPWCGGSTRSISVVVKNNGTATWTDASPDVNIGVRWNGWSDYLYRMNAGGLAPGATQTYTFPLMQASNVTAGGATGLPPTYGTSLAIGTNNLTFDAVVEGACWFGGNAGVCSGGNTVFTTPAISITAPVPVQPGVISGTVTQCPARSGQVYSIGAVANALSYNWTVPAGWTITFGAGTPSITVTTGTAGQNGNISVTAQNACGIGPVRDLAVTVQPDPTVNVGAGLAAICQGGTSAALGGSVTLPATGGTWSSSAGGTFSPNATTLNATWVSPAAFAGTATLTLTSSGGTCGTASGSKTITVNPLPGTPGTITGSSSVCQGQSGVSFSIPAIANATSYFWSYSGVGFTASGNTASITGSFGSNATSGNLTVRGVNACGNGVFSANFPITMNSIPDVSKNFTVWMDDALPLGATPIGDTDGWNWISSNPTPRSGAVSHTSALLSGFHQHYFQSATAGLPISTGEVLYCWIYLDPLNPPTSIMIQWNDGNWEHRAYWGPNNFTVGVDGTNSRRFMGAVPAAGQWVRLDVPASQVGLVGSVVRGMAFGLFNGRASWDDAGKYSVNSITGSATACQNLNGVAYSVPANPAATSYIWSYSGTGLIPSGNTAAITADFTSTATPGNLTVAAQNSCGIGPATAPFAIALAQVPVTPGNISGPSTICKNQGGFTFTVPTIANATSYFWEYTGTGITFTGSGATVTANVSNTATSGTIRVRGVSACLNGPWSPEFSVTVIDPPTVSITSNYCNNPGFVILTASSGFTSYLWSNGGTTQFIDADISGQFTVTATNSIGCTATASVGVASELLTNGRFNLGNTGFTTAYSFRPNLPSTQSELIPEATYTVVSNANFVHPQFYGTARTPAGGAFMVINGTSALGQSVWSQNNITVQPYTTYYFSAWALSVYNSNNAALRFTINGNQVGTTAILPNGYTNTAGPFNWVRFYGSWYSGFTTTVNLSIINLNTLAFGNDFALDDISFGTLSPEPLAVNPATILGTNVCASTELVINANGVGGASPFTYQWTGPNGFTSTEMNPIVTSSASAANTGTYTLNIIDGFGCTASGSVTIGISPLPLNRTPVATLPSVCVNGNSSITIASSQAGVSYQLRNDANDSPIGDPVAGTGGTITFPINNLTSTITYNVLGTIGTSQCSVEMPNTVTITVATTPVLSIINQAVCSGTVDLTDAAVTAGSTGSGTLSYWTDPAGTIALSDPNAVASSGMYYIRSTVGSCSDIEPVSVSITPTPDVIFSYPGTPYCSIGSDPSAVLGSGAVAGVFSSTTSGLVFLSTSSGKVDLSASTPGTYTVMNTVSPAGGCPSVNSTSNIVITQAPLTDFVYDAGADFCQLYSAQNPAPVFAPGAAAGTFATTFGLQFVSTATGVVNLQTSTPGNYAVWNTRPAVGGCAAESDTVFIDINPYVFDGTVTTSASDYIICQGDTVDLFSQTTPYNGVLLRERFNGSINNWTLPGNSSSGGSTTNAAWTLRPTNYNYNSVTYRSNDNSQFYVSNSQAQAGTTTLTTLPSPQLSTVGYTTLFLDFFHYFNTTATGDTARVQVSLNNSTWTTVATYTTIQGSPTSFANPVINLNAYIGQPVFFIRFQYKVTNDRLWAIDNVSLTGNSNKYTYNWVSAPAGFTSSVSDPLNVIPPQNTFYVLNATNTFGCTNPSSPLPITVNTVPVLTSTTTPPAICSDQAFSYTPTATPLNVTLDWTRPLVSGISNPAITTPQVANPNEVLVNTTNTDQNVVYSMRLNNNGCQRIVPVTVPVKPVPIIDVGSDLNVCNGSPAQLNASVTNGLSANTYTWSPTTGLNDATSGSPTSVIFTASQSYTVTVLATNGCSNTSSSVSVSNIGFGGTPGLWLGTQSNLWDDCRNWADGKVPTASTNVTIDGSSSGDIVITGSQSCNNLSLNSNAAVTRSLIISSNAALSAVGDVSLNNTLAGGILKLEIKNNATLNCQNLTITGSAAAAANAVVQKQELNTMLMVNGNLALNEGGELDLNDDNNATADGTLNIRGNFANNANAADFNIGNTSIIFSGSALQTITCPAVQDFINLTLNNTSAAGVRLNNNLTISQQMNFVNGLFDLNGNTLTLGSPIANAAISGSDNNSYILSWDGADNGSVVQRVNSVSSAYVFPIGDQSNYTPFTVNLTSAMLDNASITAKLVRNSHPAVLTSTIYLGRYWSIEPTGITNPVYGVEYIYASDDIFGGEDQLLPYKYNSAGWQSCIESSSNAMIGNGSVNTSTKTLTWSGITTFSEFTGVGNGNPLPIELLSFTAEPLDEEVQLEWTTLSEINNSFFTVERSIDGEEFEIVNQQAGAGNSNGVRTYNAVDPKPHAGLSYYRLKQTDFNGDFTYSGMVPVNFEGEYGSGLNVIYADRTNGTLHIRCSNAANSEIIVEIFDAGGRMIQSATEARAHQNWNGVISISDLSRGSYIARITISGKPVYGKFIF